MFIANSEHCFPSTVINYRQLLCKNVKLPFSSLNQCLSLHVTFETKWKCVLQTIVRPLYELHFQNKSTHWPPNSQYHRRRWSQKVTLRHTAFMTFEERFSRIWWNRCERNDNWGWHLGKNRATLGLLRAVNVRHKRLIFTDFIFKTCYRLYAHGVFNKTDFFFDVFLNIRKNSESFFYKQLGVLKNMRFLC